MRAIDRRQQGFLTGFDSPEYVFEHHDRIIHDQTDSQHQAQQSQHVDGIAHRSHDNECCNHRYRYYDRWYQGSKQGPQENIDDHQHQAYRHCQGLVHLEHRCFDKFSPVVIDLQEHTFR